MQVSLSHKKPESSSEKSIFGTIFSSMLVVLLIEVLLLVASIYLMRVGPQLDQNAEDILAMQVETRGGYIQSQLLEAQELSSLSTRINTLTEELLADGSISLDTLDSGSEAALPLLKAATPRLISTLRSRPVTGIFLVLNTHDLDQRQTGERMPVVYLRDLDPDAPPSDTNSDLMFERAPAQLVQSQSIYTDKSWEPALAYRALGKGGLLYPPFQAAYQDEVKLDTAAYGHWTTSSYILTGDTRPAIAYSQPLILPDGTVYGVIGVEILTSYLTDQLPYGELQSDNSGGYFLAFSDDASSNIDKLSLTPVLSSTRTSALSSLSSPLQFNRKDKCYRMSQAGSAYISSIVSLELYSRNAPFSNEQWCLVGVVPTSHLFAFSQRVQQLLFLTVLLTLIVGFSASWLISERMSKPVTQLSAEVEAAQAQADTLPHLSKTGIAEVDQFASAITQLSTDVLASSTRFLRIMEMASVELAGYELRGDILYTTDNFFPMLGLKKPADLTPESFRAQIAQLEKTHLYRTTPNRSRIFAIPQSDGSTQYIILRVTHIASETPSEVGMLEDCTSPMLEQQRIEHERDYDMLTGLYSRQAFNRVCHELFAQPEKLGCAALLMMDLDNLKRINDTYGHDWGDQYIRQTGQCFTANTPAGTICSRLSGDEFLLLFYGYRSQEEIRVHLNHLNQALHASRTTLPNGRTLNISISGGVAWYPEDGRDLKTLKKYADFAMYQVKQSHKGHMSDFDIGMYHREEYAAQIQRDFETMLKEELVTYYFQPIFSAQNGQITAYEALMRVNMPTLTSPAQVMTLAHELDRLYDIERLTVFKSSECFTQLQQKHLIRKDALLFLNSIANISVTDADHAEYVRRYPELLKQLVVEITEQEELDHECLERKRNVPGFSGAFALDDYGSGYSNEINLLELSPRYIKIDISIIRGIDTDRDKQQIVSNIVAYAHARSMKLIAEGIENDAELRKVIDLGVDLLQGFYLSRPAAVPTPIAPQALETIRELYSRRSSVG